MKPNVVSADVLFEEFRSVLKWEWVAGLGASERRFDEVVVRAARSGADLVGYLNYIHPYRVLTQFEQAGILSRSHFESGKAVYELNEGQHHDHLVCTSCGKVEEFYDAEIERRQQMVAKAKHWLLQDHAMSLYGLCASCATDKR